MKRCLGTADGLHWTASEKIKALEQNEGLLQHHLRKAQPLLLAGAAGLDALSSRKKRRAVPSRPDALDLETEAAKISDTFAVMYDDPTLSRGPTFDHLEGR